MSRLTIEGLDGWCASGCTPPTTIPAPDRSVKVLCRTVTLEAPRPTPESLALASLPMPRPTWPRWRKVLSLKVMLVAAGACHQPFRAASNSWQPDWHEVRKSDGCWTARAMNVPLCWLAYPIEVLGLSQVVCSKTMPRMVMLATGLDRVPLTRTSEVMVGRMISCPTGDAPAAAR